MREFGEYLIFFAIGVIGIAGGSWLWVLTDAMMLLLIRWDRYRDIFARAGQVKQ